MNTQTAERAFMCPDGKGFGDEFTAVATRLRGSPRIDFNDTTTSTQSLVAEHLDEAIPRGIINMFSEVMVTNHSLDIELFNCDKLVSVSNNPALFVEEIGSLVDDFVVDSCDLESSFLSVSRTFGFFIQSSLESSKSVFGLYKESRVLDDCLVREGCKILKPNINADLFLEEFMPFGFNINLTTKKNKPLVGSVPLYGHSFDFAFGDSMKDNVHISYSRNMKLFIGVKFKSMLRICNTPNPFLESGIANFNIFTRFLFLTSPKKVFKSITNPIIKVLENLRKNNAGINIKVFYAFIKVNFSQMFTCILISFNTDFKKFVIGSPAYFKMFRKTIGLLPAWIEPEFVVSQFHSNYLIHGFKCFYQISPINKNMGFGKLN